MRKTLLISIVSLWLCNGCAYSLSAQNSLPSNAAFIDRFANNCTAGLEMIVHGTADAFPTSISPADISNSQRVPRGSTKFFAVANPRNGHQTVDVYCGNLSQGQRLNCPTDTRFMRISTSITQPYFVLDCFANNGSGTDLSLAAARTFDVESRHTCANGKPTSIYTIAALEPVSPGQALSVRTTNNVTWVRWDCDGTELKPSCPANTFAVAATRWPNSDAFIIDCFK